MAELSGLAAACFLAPRRSSRCPPRAALFAYVHLHPQDTALASGAFTLELRPRAPTGSAFLGIFVSKVVCASGVP
jgi:hypothetical protein